MKQSTSLLIIAALAGLIQACSASSGSTLSNDSTTKSDTAKMSSTMTATSANAPADTAFANEAAMGGMAEVALGKMAADKGADPKVKDFGNLMVTDHGKANDELKSIARAESIQLPADMDAKHQALSDSLGKLSGKAFDVAYVNAMLDDHKNALALMQSEAATGANAELRSFAAKTETVIRSHLNKIQKIHDDMK